MLEVRKEVEDLGALYSIVEGEDMLRMLLRVLVRLKKDNWS